MLLTTILNQCYRFKGFIYGQARFVRYVGWQATAVVSSPLLGTNVPDHHKPLNTRKRVDYTGFFLF